MNHHKKYVRKKRKQYPILPKIELPKTHDAKTYIMEAQKDQSKKLMMITIQNRQWVHIENYLAVDEYKACKICIRGKKFNFIIEGKNLSIVYFTEDDILISGIFERLGFR